MEEQVRLVISGRVQGVFYRKSLLDEATKLKLKGWVRNTEDGGVEAVAEGEKAILERLIAWCQKGPTGARVEKVTSEWLPAERQFPDFKIIFL